MATPKPWEAGTIPTSEQLTDWFLEQPHDEQVAIMSVLQADQRTAAACWQQDHGGILVTLETLEARIADLHSRDLVVEWRARANRYRAAWLSARRDRRNLRGAWAELVRQATANRVTEVQLVTTYSDYLPAGGKMPPAPNQKGTNPA